MNDSNFIFLLVTCGLATAILTFCTFGKIFILDCVFRFGGDVDDYDHFLPNIQKSKQEQHFLVLKICNRINKISIACAIIAILCLVIAYFK